MHLQSYPFTFHPLSLSLYVQGVHLQSYPSTFRPLSLCLRDAPSILPLHVPPSLSLCLRGAPSILPLHVPPSLSMFKGCTFNLTLPRSTLSLYVQGVHLQSYPSMFHPLSLCLRDAPSILPLHVPPSLSMFKGCTFNLNPPRSALSLYVQGVHLQSYPSTFHPLSLYV